MVSSLVSRMFVAFLTAFLLVAPSAKASNAGLAVVLIDMQDGFYLRGGAAGSVGLKKLVHNQARLMNWAVQNKVPVLVLEYEDYGETDPKLMKTVKQGKYKIIQKNTDGGFYGMSRNEVLSTLASWKVDSLIVAGINGPYCVKSTIVGAMEAGFDVMTTSWIIGDINVFPPTFPNGSWYFKDSKFTVFPTLESIIR